MAIAPTAAAPATPMPLAAAGTGSRRAGRRDPGRTGGPVGEPRRRARRPWRSAEAKRSIGSRASALRVIAARSGGTDGADRRRVRDRAGEPGERHSRGAVALPRPDRR